MLSRTLSTPKLRVTSDAASVAVLLEMPWTEHLHAETFALPHGKRASGRDRSIREWAHAASPSYFGGIAGDLGSGARKGDELFFRSKCRTRIDLQWELSPESFQATYAADTWLWC